MKALKKVVRGVTLAELWATALTFVIMVVCYFISVVNRNFIKGSMPWTEELALYCMVYMALIGTELGLRDGHAGERDRPDRKAQGYHGRQGHQPSQFCWCPFCGPSPRAWASTSSTLA